MTSSLTLGPEDSHPEPSSGQGCRSDRVRPGAIPCAEREVLGVSDRKRDRAEAEIETEETLDPEVMRGFVERNASIERGSMTWKILFDELVMDRLKGVDMRDWMRESRKRELEAAKRMEDAGLAAGEQAANPGVRAEIEHDGEPVDGRSVRVPTLPYVPTEKERREHNVTHYPHRTWCEVCMAGRAIAGAHRRCAEEVDPRAGELHFDYCFLKNKPAEDPAVTLDGVDKVSDAIIAHVVPEKGNRFEGVATQLGRDVRRLGYHGRVVNQPSK